MEETEQERADRLANEAKKKRSWTDFLNPLNWFSGGGGGIFDTIGSIFGFIIPMLIFAPVLYFVAKSDWAQEMIGKLFDDEGKEGSGKAKVKGFLDKIDAGLESFLSPLGITMFDGATERLINNANAETARELMVDHSDGAITAEMAQLIAPDDATWKANLALFKRAGGNFRDPKSFETAEFKLAILRENPALARGLIAAKAKASATSTTTTAAGGTDPAAGTSAPAAAVTPTLDAATAGTIRELVKGEGLTVFLAPSERVANLESLLVSSPVKMSAAKLASFIEAVGMKDGKPTDALRSALTNALTPDANGKLTGMLPALTQFIAAPELQSPAAAKALAELAQSIDLNTVTDANQKQLVLLLRSNAGPTLKLLGDLGPEKTTQLLALMDSTNRAPLISAALREPAFKTFVATVDATALPADMQKMILELRKTPEAIREEAARVAERGVDPIKLKNSFLVTDKSGQPVVDAQGNASISVNKTLQNILKPDGRKVLLDAGTDSLARMASLSGDSGILNERNLKALLKFGKDVDATSNTKAQDDRDLKVMEALVMKMKGDETAFKALVIHPKTGAIDPKGVTELSSFFRDHKLAFGRLLGRLDTRALPAKDKKFFETLRDHWDKPGDSLGNVLASTAGIKLIYENLEQPPSSAPDWAKEAYLGIFKGRYLSASLSAPVQTNEIAQNLPAIMALLKAHDVSAATTSATSVPRPSVAAGYQPVRGG